MGVGFTLEAEESFLTFTRWPAQNYESVCGAHNRHWPQADPTAVPVFGWGSKAQRLSWASNRETSDERGL